MDRQDAARRIRARALELGYADCGMIDVAELHEYGDVLADRLERFPEMKAAFERFAAFARPEERHPWGRSLVVCASWYGKYRLPPHLLGRIGKSFLVDIRNNPASEGHRRAEAFEAFLLDGGLRVSPRRDGEVAPLRWAAMKAGLGVVRKNNFFYNERGSWIWLEAWLVDAELELRGESAAVPCPEACDLCRRACPTGSLSVRYAMNAATCVTALTAFRGCGVHNPLNERMGGWLFGCDACQDACPRNHGAWTGEEDFPGLSDLGERLSLEKLLAMDYAEMRERLSPKFFYIGPDDVWKWKTAALNALHREWREDHRPLAERAARDENEHVRAMAEWVLERHPVAE